MTDDFLKQEEKMQDDPTQVSENIKIGEKEYSQDELTRLVGLGEIAKEAEEKYNTKIDRIWPEYTKSRQQLSEIESKQREQQLQEINQKADQGEKLTQDDIRKQAAAELRQLMRDPEIQADLRQNYVEQRQAEKLIEDAEFVVSQSKDDGKPVTSVDDILRHMSETGIRNPQKAYNDLFEKELDTWKEKQLGKLKQPGLVTHTFSTAGGKQPAPVNISRSNLKDLLHEELSKAQILRGE